LFVPEPSTEIIGFPDLYIDRGSTINLTCVVLHSPEPPAYIFWNHNDAVSVALPKIRINSNLRLEDVNNLLAFSPFQRPPLPRNFLDVKHVYIRWRENI